MLSAGAPDITPQNMRFAGTPEYLRGIVKAPDIVTAETGRPQPYKERGGEVQEKGEIPTMPCGAIL